MSKINIVGLVPIYNPTLDDIKNIENYVAELDYCYLLDDSEKSNDSIFRGLIDSNKDKVEYVHNETNLGLCASVNNGIKLAEQKNADWILIMNPDGTFQNDAIGIYRKFIEEHNNQKIAILAPVFNIDRRPKSAGYGYKNIRYADMTGCLYNAIILKKLGYYDERTYFYGLDVEYCLRVLKNGYKIVECSEAVLNHHPAQTYEVKIFGKTVFKCGKDSPQRYYYQFRSGYLINKEYRDFYNFAFMAYKFIKVVFLFDQKKEYFKYIRLGIRDAKNGKFGKYIN